MKNLLVKHVVFGEGKVVEVIDRSGSYDFDKETGEVVFKKTGLPNLLKVEFESGEVKTFQDVALTNPKWFELENEEVIENE